MNPGDRVLSKNNKQKSMQKPHVCLFFTAFSYNNPTRPADDHRRRAGAMIWLATPSPAGNGAKSGPALSAIPAASKMRGKSFFKARSVDQFPPVEPGSRRFPRRCSRRQRSPVSSTIAWQARPAAQTKRRILRSNPGLRRLIAANASCRPCS